MIVQADLLELLRNRGIAHPTRLGSVSLENGDLRLGVEGWRWWSETGGHDSRVELRFEGIRAGCFDAALLLDRDTDEALEHLSVTPLAEVPWAFSGTSHATYCQQSVPDPLVLYRQVHDLLVRTHAPYGVGDYLNAGETMGGFCTFTRNSDYLIANAPTAVHDLIQAELVRQGVAHNVLVHTLPRTEGLFVRLGQRRFRLQRGAGLLGPVIQKNSSGQSSPESFSLVVSSGAAKPPADAPKEATFR